MVQAQTVPDDGAAQSLETVTVTGRRPPTDRIVIRRSTGGALFGESDLKEIPFTVNIVGETEIKNRQATNISGALATDPSIGAEYVDTGATFGERLVIRGFTQGDLVINGQLTGLDTGFVSASSVDRLEVLRGPAAFRYGFVAPGGIINIVTKRPLTNPRTSVAAGVTDDGLADAQIDHASHFDADKRFGYRLNALASGGPSYVQDNRRRTGVLATAIDFKLSPDLTIYADVNYTRTRSEGGGAVFPNVGISPEGRYFTNEPDARRNFQPDWSYYQTTNQLGGLELNWNLTPQWRLNGLLRVVDTEEELWGGVTFNAPWQLNGDHELTNYGALYNFRTYSGTVFAQGELEAAGLAHKFTVGANRVNARLDVLEAANNFTLTAPGNYFDPGTLADTGTGGFTTPAFNFRSRQSGVFASNEMRIGAWRPLVGVRWSRLNYETREASAPSTASKVSPMLALSYDFSDKLTAYSSYATGLQDGGRAPLGTANENAQMPPLQTKGYELGLKSDLAGGLVTLDAALFSVQKTAAFVDAGNVYVQSGNQVHNGFEVMLKGRVAAPLEVSAGFTYLDAQIKDNPALAGSRPTNVSSLRGVLYAEYSMPSVPGLVLTGLLNAVGKRETNLPNQFQVPGYRTLGLGARYSMRMTGEQALTFRLNVDNITDERYWVKVGEFDALPGAPRTVKASATADF